MKSLQKLYSLRTRCDRNTLFEDYSKLYRFISVDRDAAYTSGGETWREIRWKEGGINELTVPDAIIMNGVVIKNRYGYNGAL